MTAEGAALRRGLARACSLLRAKSNGNGVALAGLAGKLMAGSYVARRAGFDLFARFKHGAPCRGYQRANRHSSASPVMVIAARCALVSLEVDRVAGT